MKYTLKQLNEKVERANTVGGYLDLSGLTSIPEGFNPTVGRWVGVKPWLKVNFRKLKNGDYVDGKYLYCDNMLVHVKRKKKVGDYTFFVGKIKGVNVIFDGENYAHCASFKDGVYDIEFKKAKDRGADQYKAYTLDTVVTFEEAKTMYRVITGACKVGTENFIKRQREVKKEYTVRELIDITEGEYRAEVFKKFFAK